MPTPLFIQATLHDGPNSGIVLIPYVDNLPVVPSNGRALILDRVIGSTLPGLYVYDNTQTWRYAMPIEAVSAIVVDGDACDIYLDVTQTYNLGPSTIVYRNGQLQVGHDILPSSSVYAVRTPSAAAGGITAVQTSGTGTSLVKDTVSGVVSLKSLEAGTNITITDDGSGTLTVSSTGGGGSGSVTLTGDVTGSGTGTVATTLAASGVSAGTYTKVTVDTKGRVTLGANPTTLTGYGITDALNLGGGSMLGDITMTTGKTVKGLPDPVNASDAANRNYVDAQVAAVVNGVSWRTSVAVATTGNLPLLSGLQTVDGYTLQVGDRVLVKDQATAADNGAYVAASGTWTRASDSDTGTELFHAAYLVINGTTNGLTQWVNTNTTAPVVGTDAVTFSELRGSGNAYTAGAGLQLSGLQFSIAPTGVTANTYTKVTVNALGQVTGGSALTSSDISAALGYTPYDGTVNSGGFLTANQTITVSGDATGSGSTSISLILASSGVTAGTYTKVTVDAKGRVTAGANPTTLAGYGITDAMSNSGGSVTGTLTFSGGATVTGLPTPSAAGDATSKSYVDAQVAAVAQGVSWKANAQAASTANLTLSGTQTIDGYTVQVGDRVLVKNQTTQSQNGVYVVASGAWTRATDADVGSEVKGMAILVINGTTNALSQWVNTNTTVPTVGTDSITYTKLQSSGSTYTAGTGLTLSSNQFSITNTGVTANTYTKVTVNAQGQVTAGASLTSSDVTTALGYTPVNKAGDSLTGSLNWNAIVSLASASTLNIGAATSNLINVTGTTAITAFDSAAGAVRTLVFAGALTLTHGASSIVLPGSANITTAAGDVATFFNVGGTTWRCLAYTKADGTPIVGGGGSGSPYSTVQIFNGSTTNLAAEFVNVAELMQVTSAAPTTTTNFDLQLGAVQQYTVNTTTNWTLNFRFNSTMTLNTALNTNMSVTAALVVQSGATAFRASAFQIDGTPITPKWQGGVAPTAGTVSGYDIYTFTIVKTGSNAWIMFATQSGYQ